MILAWASPFKPVGETVVWTWGLKIKIVLNFSHFN